MKLRDENGQTIVFTLLALVGVLGMTALVLDVGSWFRAQRDAQATADAAALAGAQCAAGRPDRGAAARSRTPARTAAASRARTSRSRSTSSPNGHDHACRRRRPATSFFAQVLRRRELHRRTRTRRRPPSSPAQAQYVAPDGRRARTTRCSRGRAARASTRPTTTCRSIPWARPARSGCSTSTGGNGSVGSSTEAAWITHGLRRVRSPLGDYDSDPGAKFSSRAGPGRAQQPDRHGPALPGLQHARPATARTPRTRSSAGSAST